MIKYYKKVKEKYIECTPHILANGLWLVTRGGKSSQRIATLSQINRIRPTKLASLHSINFKLTRRLSNYLEEVKKKTFKEIPGGGVRWTNPSVQDIVDCILQGIAEELK